jgi:hypothetical protein
MFAGGLRLVVVGVPFDRLHVPPDHGALSLSSDNLLVLLLSAAPDCVLWYSLPEDTEADILATDIHGHRPSKLSSTFRLNVTNLDKGGNFPRVSSPSITSAEDRFGRRRRFDGQTLDRR